MTTGLGLRRGAMALAAAILLATAANSAAAVDLQAMIDAASPGDVVRVPPGHHRGGLVIRKPITLSGGEGSLIDAGGAGSVIQLLTDGATVRGLHLRGSGDNHDHLDAGVQVRGNGNSVLDNRIEDCLFGVDLQKSNGNTLRGNQITSKDLVMGMRGDGVRLWYSRENQIVDNVITDVRDVVVWYSGDNRIAGNRVTGSRYALHFMYSEKNLVEGNRYDDNMVGIFLMYSDGVEIRDNHIFRGRGATAMGIGFKESSNVVVERNTIIDCAKGIYLDISPYEPDTTNRFIENRFAFNGVGVLFHSDWHSNVFERNDFVGNFSQVVVRGGGGATRHTWSDNYWDDYQGFDRNADDVGDLPFELFAYADRFWVDLPPAEFFRGSPLFEVIDFLDRLAPFSSPTLILRDELPRFSAIAAGGT